MDYHINFIAMFTRKMNIKHGCKLYKVDVEQSIMRTESAVDSFYKIKSVSQHTGRDIVHYSDPIHILFNQQRIQNLMGTEALRKFIDSLRNTKNDPLAELRKKCSDDDLLAFVKSRNLQSPSEIMAWSRYMSNNMNVFNEQIREFVKQQNEQIEKQTTNVEPAPTAE